MKTVCFSVLAAMLGIADNASAVIRSPYPSRPTAPYQGHYISFSNDSLMVASPKPAKPAPSR